MRAPICLLRNVRRNNNNKNQIIRFEQKKQPNEKQETQNTAPSTIRIHDIGEHEGYDVGCARHTMRLH